MIGPELPIGVPPCSSDHGRARRRARASAESPVMPLDAPQSAPILLVPGRSVSVIDRPGLMPKPDCEMALWNRPRDCGRVIR